MFSENARFMRKCVSIYIQTGISCRGLDHPGVKVASGQFLGFFKNDTRTRERGNFLEATCMGRFRGDNIALQSQKAVTAY